ncbi:MULTISPECIES: hypothetical protein [Burkholderia]|uniref:hypothetical protein n=1 Tax=Burkholderia TaxID=32008 RepID=UPI001589BCE9|nr:hypothetical protein [Burkholderia ambifaria]
MQSINPSFSDTTGLVRTGCMARRLVLRRRERCAAHDDARHARRAAGSANAIRTAAAGKRYPAAPSCGTAPAGQSKRNVVRRYSGNAMR